MFYRGLILDLDNTLYDYTECHTKTMGVCLEYLSIICGRSIDVINELYESIANKLKWELGSTASSHNKAIYLKQLLEQLGCGYGHFAKLHELYWQTFYDILPGTIYPGVADFLEWNKTVAGVKIAILTDYETEYQILKLEKLDILQYIDHIVTSEEVGIEKPSQQMFRIALDKMNMRADDVIMIGDDFKKDICGAMNCGIYSYYFTPRAGEPITNPLQFSPFFSYVDLLEEFKGIYEELCKFVELSRHCGERFDLVQAGGGNVSVKIAPNQMVIKSSGVHLANISATSGYSIIRHSDLASQILPNTPSPKLDDAEDERTKSVASEVYYERRQSAVILEDYTVIRNQKPSIETYMHAVLKRYVVHLHPIQVNRILVSTDARSIVNELYPDALFLEYQTPGIKIAHDILTAQSTHPSPSIIFLQNHGIILTTDRYEELYTILEQVLEKFELKDGVLDVFSKYTPLKNSIRSADDSSSVLPVTDLNRAPLWGADSNLRWYKMTNRISGYIHSCLHLDVVTYLSTNRIIYSLLAENLDVSKITFPDAVIYCGIPLYMKEFSDIEVYYKTRGEVPRVIIYHGYVYIVGANYNKVKEIEDVFISNLMILSGSLPKAYLADSELKFLTNWDAEKYRRAL